MTGRVKGAPDTGQNLAQVQARIARALDHDLQATLGGRYCGDIQFRLVQVTFDPAVERSVTVATAARAQVATTRLEAQQRVETAIGDRRVAEQKARAIRATRDAYRDNPAQARIDAIRALPAGLRALGGNLSTIVSDPAVGASSG